MNDLRLLFIRSVPTFCLVVGLLVPTASLAASNEELLKIIERLEARIEQLESKTAEEIPRAPEASEAAVGASSQKVLPKPETKTEPQVENDPKAPAVNSPVYLTDSPPVPPMEMVPTPVATSRSELGDWHLYLNIDTANTDLDRQPFYWQNVSQPFDISDENGKPQQLLVKVTMTGNGARTKAGRSLFLQPYFNYDFRFAIRYELILDGRPIVASEKYLYSDVLGIDRSGQISDRLLYSKDNLNTATIDGLPVLIQFGCLPSDYKVTNNLVVSDRTMLDINRYACLRLDFAD